MKLITVIVFSQNNSSVSFSSDIKGFYITRSSSERDYIRNKHWEHDTILTSNLWIKTDVGNRIIVQESSNSDNGRNQDFTGKYPF